MIMVGHEAVGMTDPVVPFVDVLKGVEEVQTIGVILEDGLFLVASGRHMINGAGVFYAKGAGHDDPRIASKSPNVKIQDVTHTYIYTRAHYNCRAQQANSMVAHNALAHKLARASSYIIREGVPLIPETCLVGRLPGTVNLVSGWQNHETCINQLDAAWSRRSSGPAQRERVTDQLLHR
jgi:hypothetical protein